MGRVPVHHLPRRRGRRDRQPQRQAPDPLFPRTRRGAEGEPAAALRARRRDHSGRRLRGPSRLRRAAAADPSRREPGPAAGRRDPGEVCGVRSAGPRRRGPHRAALRRAARGAGACARRECGADPPHRRDPGQGNGRAMVPPVRGRRPRRDRGQTAGRAVPAGQALHVQGQARTHRRLRPGRVPGAYLRTGPDRVTAAGALRRRRRPRQRRRGGGLPDAAPQGTLRGAPAARDQLRGPPLGLGPAGGGDPDAAQCPGQPVERRQGPLLHAAPAGPGGGSEIRPHGGRTVPPHDAVCPLAPGPGSRSPAPTNSSRNRSSTIWPQCWATGRA